MRKTFLLALVCLFIASGLDAKWYIATQDIRVRSGKGIKFQELGTIPKGSRVESKDTTGTWREVVDQGEVGYINSKCLEEAPPEAPMVIDNSTVGVGKKWVNDHIVIVLCGIIALLLILRSIMLSIAARKSENTATQYHDKYKSLVKYWFQCKHCAASIKNDTEPSANGCSKSLHHLWTNLGEVGQHKYHCKNCNVTVHTKMDPNDHGCPSAPLHRWEKKK